MGISPETWQGIVRGERRGLRATLLRAALWWARWPYGAVVCLRNRLFDLGWKRCHRASVPVISIGNLTLGGTGKTPCVEYVARYFREHDIQVAILSRGYGADGGRNDEAILLEENLPDVPHLQGTNRVELAATAVEELESELLVLDDGFQHRRLFRNLDVVLVDTTNPWGHGYLFPRGALREPLGSLRRANVIMLTRADRVSADAVLTIRQRIAAYTKAPVVVTRHATEALIDGQENILPLSELQGKRVAGFCGIGNPEAFRKSLEDLGATVVAFRIFPDHHPYTKTDVDSLIEWADTLAAGTMVITTQKDMVKLRLVELAERPVCTLRIRLSFLEGQVIFDSILHGLISESSGPDSGR